jgi:hypothetical protein
VNFDDPHLGAGTNLEAGYPSGVMDWPQGEWKIGVPAGKFGTFNLAPANPNFGQLELAFHAPRIFAGIDVYNGGPSEATVTIRSGNAPAVASTLRPGELRRIRTAWKDPSLQVVIERKPGDDLKFDNLAYFYP